jgi:hypothetical protein
MPKLPEALAMLAVRPWKGRWLLSVALLHTMVAAILFAPQWRALWQRGVFNAVAGDARMGHAVWFLLFGAVLALLAWEVTALERSQPAVALRPMGWCLLALVLAGGMLMPVSGFWLVLPPALALLVK